MKELSRHVMESRINNCILESFFTLTIDEAKIVELTGSKNARNYGQCIIMAGGAASGKGYVQQFIDASFKVFDVDELKQKFAKAHPAKEDGTEWDFKDPKDVFRLHMEVKNKGWKGKERENLIKGVMGNDSKILPNILFDITAKDKEDIDEVIALVKILGYKTTLVYMVQSTDVAKANNRLRSRSVPVDVLIGTHDGSFKTVPKYLKSPNELDAAWIYLGYDARFYDVDPDEKANKAYKLEKTSNGGFAISTDLEKKIYDLRNRKIDMDRLNMMIHDKQYELLHPRYDKDGNVIPLPFTMKDLMQIYADLRKK